MDNRRKRAMRWIAVGSFLYMVRAGLGDHSGYCS
jgi:hypothetical protein